MKPLGELKKTLFERRIKQGWLAQQLHVSEAHVSMLLAGKRRLKTAYRRKIAGALQMRQEALFGNGTRRAVLSPVSKRRQREG